MGAVLHTCAEWVAFNGREKVSGQKPTGPSYARGARRVGAPPGTRTPDPLIKSQLL